MALAAGWLHDGLPVQVPALIYALERLTGLRLGGREDWIAWYSGTGSNRFPTPDYRAWIAEVEGA